jgi:hypothetical protein
MQYQYIMCASSREEITCPYQIEVCFSPLALLHGELSLCSGYPVVHLDGAEAV